MAGVAGDDFDYSGLLDLIFESDHVVSGSPRRPPGISERAGTDLRSTPALASFLPVLVLLVPFHLNCLEDTLVGALGIVREPGQLHDPLVQIREAHHQQIGARILRHQRQRDVLRILSSHRRSRHHFGISTTTSQT
jgi:hypothetical protein